MREQMIFEEIAELRSEIGNLRRRVDELETRPEEILDEIERIWKADPETAEVGDKE